MIESDQRELFNFCGSRSWEEPAPLQRDAHAQSGCPHPAGPQRFFLALADLLPKCAAKPSGMPLSSAFQLDSCRTLWAVLAVAILGLSVQKVRQWHLSCLGPSGVGVGSDAPVSCKEGVWGWGVSRVSGSSERLGISGVGGSGRCCPPCPVASWCGLPGSLGILPYTSNRGIWEPPEQQGLPLGTRTPLHIGELPSISKNTESPILILPY